MFIWNEVEYVHMEWGSYGMRWSIFIWNGVLVE